jgi:hypothetical protein
VLRELELEFELVKVDNRSKRTADGRDFLTINPKGYVAALELDDGKILTEGPPLCSILRIVNRKAGWLHARAPGIGFVSRNGLTLSPVKYTRARRYYSILAARRGQINLSREAVPAIQFS